MRLGYTREELLELPYSDLVDSSSLELINERFENLLSAGGATYEEFLVTKCKNFIPVETNSHFITLAGEGYILSVSRDIASRKESENIREFMYCIANSVSTTKNSNELFAVIKKELGKILDTTNFCIALCSPDRQNLTCLMSDIDTGEALNVELPLEKSIGSVVIREKKSLLLTRKDFAKYEKLGLVDQSHEPQLSWLGVPLTIRNEVIGLLAVHSYVDEKAYNEMHLKVLEFVSAQLALSITKKRHEDEIHSMNIQLEDRVKKRTSALNDALSKYEQANAELMAVNKRLADESLKLLRLNDKYADSERQLMELNRALEDRVEERTQQLVLAKDRAEEMNKLKSIILGNIGHELRTPLNGILGTIQYVKGGKVSEEDMSEVLEMMNDSASRLNDTITSLLGLIEIESNQRQLYIESVRLFMNVESFYYNTAMKIKKANIELVLNVEDYDIYCDLDESLLFQSLYNIVDNAVKFTDHGKVEISVGSVKELGRNWGFVRVSDTGRGISKSNLGVIFEPFRQESEGIRRSYEGIGIGLTIVKKIVEMMNGSITVESTEGSGSQFTIRFPGYYL
jgi:signal transduction histidine kinase